MTFSFELLATDNQARCGKITTPHGEIQTPIFMPVGTQGSVKALCPQDLKNAGAQIILGNTYHLMLRPGEERMQKMGGLHQFMNWQQPILTDSGGFQAFSLSDGLSNINDEGVAFKSHLDGSKFFMRPSDSMKMQMAMGADFIMALDHCPPGQSSRDEVRAAMNRTSLWLKECIASMTRSQSRLLGIVQGGIYGDLRQEHARELAEHDLFGYAIGGFSVGEKKEDMWPALEQTTKAMPANKQRYLMGVGTPDDLLDAIALGVDMFDCVMPTRNARNGCLFTSKGKVIIKKQMYQEDQSNLDEECTCYTCRNFSKAYLRHLFMCGELLFYRLASLHNISYYLNLVSQARKAILAGNFTQFRLQKKANHLVI